MIVRPAKERDRLELVELGRVLTAEKKPHLTYDPQKVGRAISRYLAGDNSMWLVCEDGRDLIGFIVAFKMDYLAHAGFFIEQGIFYVRPDNRGTRAAASLFAEFNRWADSQHPEEVFAGTSTDLSFKAVARWMRLFGFELVGPSMRRQVNG